MSFREHSARLVLVVGVAMALLVSVAGSPATAGAAGIDDYNCSARAAYAGWNNWRQGVGLRHNFVVRFAQNTLPSGYKLYFKGQQSELDFHGPIAGQLQFGIHTSWLWRPGILSAGNWEMRWRCNPSARWRA